MGGIDGTPLNADAVEGGLHDYILLGVNAPAYLLPCPRGYTQLIPETAQLKAILKTRRSAVIAGSQDMLVLHCHRPYVVPTAG
jgi:hypothetical protein